MVKTTKSKKNKLAFSNKLILNQWLLSLFGFDSLTTDTQKPFHKLANLVKDSAEGLYTDNMHNFYYQLIQQLPENSKLEKHKLQRYEENIVKHTQQINDRREQAVVWKYYQWLTLLFIEIYLDFYFNNKEKLVNDLNTYLQRFNQHYSSYKNIVHTDIEPFQIEDLNKICLQNATGSGKTLLMHINYLQYLHYANETNNNDLSRVILITPNAELSQQHIDEFNASGIYAELFVENGLYSQAQGLTRIDAIEITRLADKQGNKTIATRSLGDNNLLLIDEGHRGLSGTNAKAKENAWFDRRSMLCEQGFSFEYSATFAQAVSKTRHEDDYAKTVIFDYSYKWFYEDGFGKDYKILNLSDTKVGYEKTYLTACLLKFYQQLDIYQAHKNQLTKFNLEKPLWVFVGNTVNANTTTKDKKELSSDIAKIVEFIAEFVVDKTNYCEIMKEIIQGPGVPDTNGNDMFANAFNCLAQKLSDNFSYKNLYQDILYKLFNATGSGQLVIDRIKGNSSEILLTVANADKAFGLINVGDTDALVKHLGQTTKQNNLKITIKHSNFSTSKFSEVKNSSSEINLLIGAKKFIEGWDCWRVSTFGLMHVGKSEGAQIIQLFGRGIRLKGYNWSLKRSSHIKVKEVTKPDYLNELETLQVFGIEATFMEKFCKYLEDEGLPTDDSKTEFTIPIDVTYQFNKQLQIITPKRSAKNKEFSFKQHGAVPYLAYKTMPKKIKQQPVIADWYPTVDVKQSQQTGNKVTKKEYKLNKSLIALLNINKLYFALEQYKRIKARYNLNIDKLGILSLLETTDWYILKIPKAKLQPQSFKDVNFLQRVAEDLLKRYCDKYYSYCVTAFWKNRLEYTELDSKNSNIPKEGASYTLRVESTDDQLKQAIKELQQQLATSNNPIIEAGDLQAYKGYLHLFQPLLHADKNCNISISPHSLNASEFNFVTDLKNWYQTNKQQLNTSKTEILLSRNLAQGKGVEFFQAGNFAPDFILWVITATKQYITFIEPHGLIHEGINSEKIKFFQTIKTIEHKLATATNKKIILNSFVVSPTEYAKLNWEQSQRQLENDYNILFMQCDKDNYIDKLFTAIIQ